MREYVDCSNDEATGRARLWSTGLGLIEARTAPDYARAYRCRFIKLTAAWFAAITD